MREAVIEDRAIKSALKEPARRFRFTDDGANEEIIVRRGASAYFIPFAQAKKKTRPHKLGTEKLHRAHMAEIVRGRSADSLQRREPAVHRPRPAYRRHVINH